MLRRFTLRAQILLGLVFCTSCASPVVTPDETQTASPESRLTPSSASMEWALACQVETVEFPQSGPDWWRQWSDMLGRAELEQASATLHEARSMAEQAFHAIRNDETPLDGSGASGPELRAWTLTWVQSATPLLVIDVRGFVWSDAVVCEQARAVALAGDRAGALAWLNEARPFLRPDSCAARCEAALRPE